MNMLRKLLASALALILVATPVYAGTGSSAFSNPSSLTHTFTATGTDTVPAWSTGVYVTEIGGGGGGGGGGVSLTGGGGGGATTVRNFFSPVTPGATLNFTIGAGGAAGLTTANGGAGGITSLTGTLYLVPQACGGLGGTSAASGAGGKANACFIGSAGSPFSYASNPVFYVGTDGAATGSSGTYTCQPSGATITTGGGGGGGCSMLGTPGQGVTSTGNGGAASGFGAGGGGGGNASGNTGGAGSPGLIILRYVQ